MLRSLICCLWLMSSPGIIKLVAQNNPAKAQLNHVALYVTNVKISTHFYQTIIGLDTVPEPFHDGKHKWFRVGPKSHLHLIEGTRVKQEYDKSTHICFSVPSVDKFIEVLRGNNIEYENWIGEKKAVTKRIDNVKQIYLKDPDGYWLEINDDY